MSKREKHLVNYYLLLFASVMAASAFWLTLILIFS